MKKEPTAGIQVIGNAELVNTWGMSRGEITGRSSFEGDLSIHSKHHQTIHLPEVEFWVLSTSRNIAAFALLLLNLRNNWCARPLVQCCDRCSCSCRVVMPAIQCILMLLPSLQVVWRSLTDMFITPLFQSMGKTLSSIQVKTTDNWRGRFSVPVETETRDRPPSERERIWALDKVRCTILKTSAQLL